MVCNDMKGRLDMYKQTNGSWVFFVLSLLFLGNIHTLKSAILILKQGQAVTENDPNKDDIYKIIITYQWPMCTAHFKEITLAEKKELFLSKKEDAEELFIQKKIQDVTKNSDYQVVFVPTVIYELFCLSDKKIYEETKENATGIGSTIQNLIDVKEKDRITLSKNEIIKNFLDINADNKTKSCFFNLNEPLWNYLQQQKNNLKPEDVSTLFTDKKIAKKIIQDLISRAKELNDVLRWDDAEKISDEDAYKEFCAAGEAISKLSIPSAVSLLSTILKEEINAKKGNHAVLYRGVMQRQATTIQKTSGQLEEQPVLETPLKFSPTNKSLIEKVKGVEFTTTSISYGNSLFAGILRDTGACAFPSIIYSERGYIITLDKSKFVFLGDLPKLFFISPLITCAALFGAGALFHSRSKVVGDSPNSPIIYGIYQGCHDESGLIYSQGDILSHVRKLSRYLSENTTIISRRWHFKKNAKEIVGEQEQAGLFSTINVLKKRAERKTNKKNKK